MGVFVKFHQIVYKFMIGTALFRKMSTKGQIFGMYIYKSGDSVLGSFSLKVSIPKLKIA